MSHDGKKAREMFESPCPRLIGRFIIGLPLKKHPTQLPNNYPLARRGLGSLERRFANKRVKAQMYDEAIEEYGKKGWARIK